MSWIYDGKNIDFLPKEVIGFVYMIIYTNGQKYIGKKIAKTFLKKPTLKSGEMRPEASHQIKRLVPMTKAELAAQPKSSKKKNKLVPYDIIPIESNWKSYTGSSKETEDLTIKEKHILHLCTNKMTLTYLETQELFDRRVLIGETYVNKNILGKFYDNCMDGIYTGSVVEQKTLF